MRILLVDDHVLFREGLAALLRGQPNILVVGEAGSVSEALDLALRLGPDLILMDVSLPDGTGADATRAILAERPQTRIVFLTMHEDEECLFDCIRAGAQGYLLKNLSIAKVVSFLEGVDRGEAAIAPAVAGRILGEFARLRPAELRGPNEWQQLTAREKEVLVELAMGASNREIAELLTITEGTVKNHVRNILAKLRLKSRREAARFVRENQLIGASTR